MEVVREENRRRLGGREEMLEVWKVDIFMFEKISKVEVYCVRDFWVKLILKLCDFGCVCCKIKLIDKVRND